MKKCLFTLLLFLSFYGLAIAQAHKGPTYYGSMTTDPRDSIFQNETLTMMYSVSYEDFERAVSPPGTLMIDLDDQYILKETDNLVIPNNYIDTVSLKVSLPEGIYTMHLRFDGYLLSTKKITILKNDTTSMPGIWPGDANGDGEANLYDPLSIAVAYAEKGPKRMYMSTSWVKQYCQSWNKSFPGDIDYCNADCNGNGIIGSDDLYAINVNYAQPRTLNNFNSSANTADPLLHFDMAGITFTQGATVNIPLRLDNAGQLPLSLYGIAANVTINGITSNFDTHLRFDNSAIGTVSNTITFTKYLAYNNIDFAIAHTDHENTPVNGTIATLSLPIPKDAINDGVITLALAGTKIIDKDGNEITGYRVASDTAYINSAGIANAPDNVREPVIAPNPAAKDAKLAVAFPAAIKLQMTVTNLNGKVIHNRELNLPSGQHLIDLPKPAPGTYIVTLQNSEQHYKKVLKWTQQ